MQNPAATGRPTPSSLFSRGSDYADTIASFSVLEATSGSEIGITRESAYSRLCRHRHNLEKVAEGAEDYYSGEGEAEGYWLGEATRLLGLEGKVEPDQLVAMLSGRHPLTGEPLGLKSAPGREPVPGFDLTFSSPKSVSLLWALGGHPASSEVAAAHRASVAEALSYLEREACWVRRGRGGAEFHPGAGFLAAGYVHRSSRAGDPQLHTHVLVANATLGPDGRWSRLYHPALYEHAKTASYIYEAHLRHELTRRLGVEWEPLRNGIADIRGFEREQLRAFSTRRAEIIEAAGEGASARSMQVAALATRRAKERDLSTESLRELWRVKGEEVGLTRESISRLLGRELPGRTVLTIEQLSRSATAHVSHFDRRGAIQAVADNLPHGAPAREVEETADAFLRSDSVIRIAESPRGPRFTTRRIWELERSALAGAAELAEAQGRCLVHPIHVRRILDERPSLKADQRAMFERLLRGGSGLEVVIGEAGTGKTYATVAAARGWEVGGVELVAAAPTWRAANVLRAEGVEAVTVARLLGRLDETAEGGGEAMPRGSVLLVDEAGMVDSRSLARLIAHARAAEAKLVLIGDPAQLGEIEAGGLFAALAARAEPIRLDEVIRHEHALDREGAKLIREGRGAEAFDRYLAEERVRVFIDARERREAMVAEWAEAHERGEDALMIAKLNSERARLNEQARELLRGQGRLGEREIGVGEGRFAAGDEVITRVNDQRARIYNRERWRVEEVDPSSGRMRLAGIDTPGRQVGVDPGYLGRVNPVDGAPAIEHAYAVTIYQAQGATVDRVFVLADPSMDRQDFYVAASRSRGGTHFYATPESQAERIEISPSKLPSGIEHIVAAAQRDGAQSAAHDAALRDRLGGLSTPELHAHIYELSTGVGLEKNHGMNRERLDEQIADAKVRLRQIAEAREQLGPEPKGRRKRVEREAWKREAEHLDRREWMSRRVVESCGAKLAAMAPSSHAARAELAVTEYLIAERLRARLAAVRLDAPDYIVRELGERPSAAAERATWDRGALMIERFRAEHGVGDREHAFGPELSRAQFVSSSGPEHRREVARQETRRRLRDQQRRLERARELVRERDLGRSMSIEM